MCSGEGEGKRRRWTPVCLTLKSTFSLFLQEVLNSNITRLVSLRKGGWLLYAGIIQMLATVNYLLDPGGEGSVLTLRHLYLRWKLSLAEGYSLGKVQL